MFGEESAVSADKLCLPVLLFQEKMHNAKPFSVLSPRKALPGTEGADIYSSSARTGLGPLQSGGIISFFQKEPGKITDFHVRMVGEKLGRSLATCS